MTCGDEPIVRLDVPLPERLVIGNGHVLYLTGRCYHPVRAIRSLAILVDGVAHAVPNHSLLRSDVPSDDPVVGDRRANSLTSGFWAAVPFAAAGGSRTTEVGWRLGLDDGTMRDGSLGALAIEVGTGVPRGAGGTGGEARVTICLASYNPEPAFFAEQIDSLIAQEHQTWCCIVSDDGSTPDRLRAIRAIAERDPRIRVVAHAERLGHYGNFARALAEVPADADFVALSDQDDVWYPDKLRRILAAFGADTTLVYADVDVVTSDRSPVTSTYWTTRRNNFTDLASLVFANTVTGAASVFRASLLAEVLPFPPRIGDAYHDHWIACVALTKGALGYVDAPLQAYRQHAGSTLGHHVPPAHRMLPRLAEIRRALGRGNLRRRLMAALWRHREVYGNDVVRLIVIAKILLLRLGGVTAGDKRAVLERVAALERAPFGLVRETVMARLLDRPTLGAEWHCLRGTLAARALDAHYRRHRERLFEERTVRRELTGGGPTTGATAAIDLIEQKLAPLRLQVDATFPVRVNLVAPAIDFAHLFAGYVGKLQLAQRLADVGHRVRIVIVDPCDHDPVAWRRGIRRYPGLEELFERIEVRYAAERDVPLDVHPEDAFIATTWWTAHLADRVARALGARPFVYLIQEFEPMTFPMGSLYALAAESYALPHRALFSTPFLRDYFRRQQIGVYASSPGAPGDAGAASFENAIATFAVTPEQLTRSGPRRLLFYARPEQHAARNMFELGVLALRAAVADGTLDATGWIVEGIGAGRAFEPVPLGGSCRLTLLPRVTLDEYQTLLPGYDAGLALMLTPHPSLVPLEMAAAGLVTVTNTYANKTADALRALSANLVPVPPTVDGVAAGIREAAGRAPDVAGRVAGAEVAWSRDWRTSLDDALLGRLSAWLTD